MAKPSVQELGINFFSVHAHGPSPIDGSQDLMSADFLEALKNFRTSRVFEIDGQRLNFMGGMIPQQEDNHDGVKGQMAVDGLMVRPTI